MGVDARKVYRKVFVSWLHTLVSIFVMLGLMSVILAVCVELGLARPVMVLLEGAGVLALGTFFFSEIMIMLFMFAKRVRPGEFPRFVSAVQQTCAKHRMSMPRLYVVEMKSPVGDPVPNAFAFGLGFFGQYAIAVSRRLYEMMDDEELKAVLDHEIGHLRSKDVGVLSTISVVVGGSRSIGQLLASGQTFLGRSTWGSLIGILIVIVNRLLFPIALAAIAQEREYAADALSALDAGSVDPMIRALRKLEEEVKVLQKNISEKTPKGLQRNRGPFDELFISHPGMAERISSLESLRNNT